MWVCLEVTLHYDNIKIASDSIACNYVVLIIELLTFASIAND